MYIHISIYTYIYTYAYMSNSALKRKEILPFVTTWMNLERLQKTNLYIALYHLLWNLKKGERENKKVELNEIESRQVIARLGGGELGRDR